MVVGDQTFLKFRVVRMSVVNVWHDFFSVWIKSGNFVTQILYKTQAFSFCFERNQFSVQTGGQTYP